MKNVWLHLAFLFFVGSVFGWCLEVVFRRFFSRNNPQRKWINPGFCVGPYLPLYGVGLCVLYLLASLESHSIIHNVLLNKLVLFAFMGICMTVIEYISGILALKVCNLRLWDYSQEWGNYKGIICPKFSLIWAGLSAIYYFLIHPRVIHSIQWLSQNLAFSFVVGLFFGIFIMDAANSIQLAAKIRAFAKEDQVIVRYERLKLKIREHHEKNRQHYHFFHPFATERPLAELLKEMHDDLEQRIKPVKKKR